MNSLRRSAGMRRQVHVELVVADEVAACSGRARNSAISASHSARTGADVELVHRREIGGVEARAQDGVLLRQLAWSRSELARLMAFMVVSFGWKPTSYSSVSSSRPSTWSKRGRASPARSTVARHCIVNALAERDARRRAMHQHAVAGPDVDPLRDRMCGEELSGVCSMSTVQGTSTCARRSFVVSACAALCCRAAAAGTGRTRRSLVGPNASSSTCGRSAGLPASAARRLHCGQLERNLPRPSPSRRRCGRARAAWRAGTRWSPAAAMAICRAGRRIAHQHAAVRHVVEQQVARRHRMAVGDRGVGRPRAVQPPAPRRDGEQHQPRRRRSGSARGTRNVVEVIRVRSSSHAATRMRRHALSVGAGRDRRRGRRIARRSPPAHRASRICATVAGVRRSPRSIGSAAKAATAARAATARGRRAGPACRVASGDVAGRRLPDVQSGRLRSCCERDVHRHRQRDAERMTTRRFVMV